MTEAIPFDDLPPEEMVELLNKARELYPQVNPLGPDFESSSPRDAIPWGCTSCGASFSIDGVLVVSGEPQCPHCDHVGWDAVHPRASD
jgi:hypothetical protein